MTCTRTGIPLRSIPAGDGHVMKKKTKIGCLAIGLLPVVLFALFIWVRGHSYTIHNATYDEASKAGVVRVFIPPQADNITAWVRPGQMTIAASFEIQESDFVAWAQSKGWALGEITNITVDNISSEADGNGSEIVASGLMYKIDESSRENPNGLYRLYVYDRTRGIGYFTQ